MIWSSLHLILCVYGDPAYPLRVHLQGPFKHGVLSPQMEEYNAAMSAVRSSVEWLERSFSRTSKP